MTGQLIFNHPDIYCRDSVACLCAGLGVSSSGGFWSVLSAGSHTCKQRTVWGSEG